MIKTGFLASISFALLSLLSLSLEGRALYIDEVPLTVPPLPPFPFPLSHRIHPGFTHGNKCLDVQGGVFESGSPVQLFDCNETPAQEWVLSRGPTKIRVADRNLCLDAGDPPYYDGNRVKIWECLPQVPAQAWLFTDDNRIRLQGQAICLDLTGGKLNNGNPVQIWDCGNGNENQVWTASL